MNWNESLIRIRIFLEVKYYIEEDAPPGSFFLKKLCITILAHDFLYLGLAFFVTKTPNVLFFIIGSSLFLCTIKLLHSTDVIGYRDKYKIIVHVYVGHQYCNLRFKTNEHRVLFFNVGFWGINNMADGVKLHITYVGLNNIIISFIFQ